LQSKSDPKTLDITLALRQKAMRIREQHFRKTHAIPGAKLCCDGQVYSDHVRYLWIAADSLAISQKQNRFPGRWNLDRAGRNGFRNKIGFVLAF
jgi:hypothetical protein